MYYMDEYPVIAWFRYHDKAVEYQTENPGLVLIVFNGGWALIDEK